jgi:hypothetical protein
VFYTHNYLKFPRIFWPKRLGLGALGWEPWAGSLGLGALGWEPWAGSLRLGAFGLRALGSEPCAVLLFYGLGAFGMGTFGLVALDWSGSFGLVWETLGWETFPGNLG